MGICYDRDDRKLRKKWLIKIGVCSRMHASLWLNGKKLKPDD